MRPVFREDAYHVAVDGGAYILTPQGPVRLNGASVGQWVERIVPHLDGTHTLAELTAALPPGRAELVERLVLALHDRDVVRDAGDEDDVVPVAPHRATPILVIGSGPLLAALVDSALCSGLTRLRVVATGEEPIEAPPAAATAVEWIYVPTPNEDDLTGLVAGASMVLHAADHGTIERAMLVDRAAARGGVPVAHAVAGGGEAWLAPAREPGQPGWSAVWPRLRNTFSTSGALTPTAAVAAAGQLVHDAFPTIAGIPAPAGGLRLTRIDGSGLASNVHRALPHPFSAAVTARTETEFRTRIDQLRRGERLSEEEFSRRAVACMDDRLGCFSYQDNDWAQVPLHVTAARAPDPTGVGTVAPATVIGAGFTYQTARCRAALGALTRYGSRLVDPRRLLDAGGRPIAGSTGHLPTAGEALAATPAGYVWGAEIHRPHAVRLVPVATAFPALHAGSAPEHPTGAAAGYDWHEAVATGVVSHCLEHTLREVASTAARYPRVSPAGNTLDDSGARCLRILSDLSEPLQIYDITGALGVPTFAFCIGATTVTYGAGLTVSEALGAGLMEILLAVQARRCGQTGYAPAPKSALAALQRRGTGDRANGPLAEGLAAVVQRLRDRGLTEVAGPLDHDPEVSKIMPYLVQVVLLDDR